MLSKFDFLKNNPNAFCVHFLKINWVNKGTLTVKGFGKASIFSEAYLSSYVLYSSLSLQNNWFNLPGKRQNRYCIQN